MLHLRGKVSWFGGPNDTGVAPDEGLAFIAEVQQAPQLFLDYQPAGTTGLARRLDPDVYYIACRWDYDETPAYVLLENVALVRSVETGKEFVAYPADWGPHEDTGRIADISPGLMDALQIQTDDVVEVTFPYDTEIETPVTEIKPYQRVVISSGHGKYIRGASGVIDEVDEARKVVDSVAIKLRARGVTVETFHDNVSTTQNENLHRIVDFHNSQDRQLDVSVHFNAYVETEDPMGTECLFLTQEELATSVVDAVALSSGLLNRGAKERSDLYFLNNTDQPAILIETCFVDSSADADIYQTHFDAICEAIADVIGGRVRGPDA